MRPIIICLILFIAKISAMPLEEDKSIVVTTNSVAEISDKIQNENEDKPPKIYKMHIHSLIENRYANTTVTSKVRNLGKSAKEATFFVVLPESAFISGFVMEIDGKNYTAYVQEKQKAQETYDKAVQAGVGAAHVAVSTRDSNKFTVSVNIEPQSKATFYLTYEELLKRINGYEMVINIHPQQPVQDLEVDVEINESSPLKYVKAPPIRTGNDVREPEGDLDPRAIINIVNNTYATIKFKPSIERQKQLAHTLGTKEEDGLAGQFVIQYEVERENNGGEILLKDGHFVHFFSPDDTEQLPKYVLFVLDTSGSMYGEKIDQVKQAMLKILSDLKEVDAFTLTEFNSYSIVWDINNTSKNSKTDLHWNKTFSYDSVSYPQAYDATKENIEKAKEVIGKFESGGGTDIMDALKTSLYVHDQQIKDHPEFNKQPLIIFLTDGQGYSLDEILREISEKNTKRIPIFALSFGSDADKDFLRKISLQNYAFSRHIYEGADAALQLENFYKRISSPLLQNVHFKYTKDVENVTKTDFAIFFKGDEYIICGKIDELDNYKDNPFSVEAFGVNGPVILKPKIKQATTGELERLWAYLTIKQLLEKKEIAKNDTELEKKALDLALKYSFVTPVSSLVVVKPNDTKAIDTQEADDNGNNRADRPALTFRTGSRAKSKTNIPMLHFGRAHNSDYDYDIIPDSIVISKTAEPALESLIAKLPWLSSLLDANKKTISLSNGKYKLGLGDTVSKGNSCSNAYNNTTGHCELLYNCDHIIGQNLISTEEIYQKYFCKIDEYAGICCPPVTT